MRMINRNIKISPFRYWCQQTLPLTFDDSLSYMELLSKVIKHLNDAVSDVATAEQDIINLHNAFVQLQSYVNDYFQNLDVQTEVDHKIDEMVENGTFDELLDPIVGSQIAGVVANQIGAVVASQIGGVVAGQIDDAVAEQIDEVVAEQIDDVVAEQIDGAVGEQISNLVDKTLSISGKAADALRTGNIRANLFADVNNFKFMVGGLNPTTGVVGTVTNETIVTTDFITYLDALNVAVDSGYKQMICAYQLDGTYVGWFDKTDKTFKQTSTGDLTAYYTSEDFYIGDYPQYKFKIELIHDTIAQLNPVDGSHARFLVRKPCEDKVLRVLDTRQVNANDVLEFAQGGLNTGTGALVASNNAVYSTTSFTNKDMWKMETEDPEVFLFSVFAWRNNSYVGYWNKKEQAFVTTTPAVHADSLVDKFDYTEFEGMDFKIVVEAYDGGTVSPIDAQDITTWCSGLYVAVGDISSVLDAINGEVI